MVDTTLVWWYSIIECSIDFNCLKMSEARFWGDRNVECWALTRYYLLRVDLEERLGLDRLAPDCLRDGGPARYPAFLPALRCAGVPKMWWAGTMGGLNLYTWALVGCLLMRPFLCSRFTADRSILHVSPSKGLPPYLFSKWRFSLRRLAPSMCSCLSACSTSFSSEK